MVASLGGANKGVTREGGEQKGVARMRGAKKVWRMKGNFGVNHSKYRVGFYRPLCHGQS